MIIEISNLLLNQNFTRKLGIPDPAIALLSRAKSSVLSITSKTLSQQCRKAHRESIAKFCDIKLAQLTVQCKFLSVAQLEAKNHVWKHIMDGFLLVSSPSS